MLDKAIAHGKEHRKQYVFREGHGDTRAVDFTCRNHGSCPYCSGNRTYKNKKAAHTAAQQIDEYFEGVCDEILEQVRYIRFSFIDSGRRRHSSIQGE